MKLDIPNEDGVSIRETLTSLFKAHGIRDERLDSEPELNFVEAQYFSWFWDLNAARQGTGFGASPISWLEMEAWSRMTCIPFKPWEFSLFRVLDNVYLKALNDAV